MKFARIFSWISFSFRQHKFRNSFCHKYIRNQWGCYGKAVVGGGGRNICLFIPSDQVLLLRIKLYLSMDVAIVLSLLIFLCLLQISKTHCGLFNLYVGDCSHPILLVWGKRGIVRDHHAICPPRQNSEPVCLLSDTVNFKWTLRHYGKLQPHMFYFCRDIFWQNGGGTNLLVRAILAPCDLAAFNFMWLDWGSENGIRLRYDKFLPNVE
jgi:hypothetical protein